MGADELLEDTPKEDVSEHLSVLKVQEKIFKHTTFLQQIIKICF